MNIRIEDSCAICSVVQNAASNLTGSVLLVNSLSQCGHKFCKSCADLQFSRKRQFACPICGGIVKASTLTEKSVHEIEVNEDFKVRKRINEMSELSVLVDNRSLTTLHWRRYNKSERDFATHQEFCDYQEMVEDIGKN